MPKLHAISADTGALGSPETFVDKDSVPNLYGGIKARQTHMNWQFLPTRHSTLGIVGGFGQIKTLAQSV
jgi:hypothetical protein